MYEMQPIVVDNLSICRPAKLHKSGLTDQRPVGGGGDFWGPKEHLSCMGVAIYPRIRCGLRQITFSTSCYLTVIVYVYILELSFLYLYYEHYVLLAIRRLHDRKLAQTQLMPPCTLKHI